MLPPLAPQAAADWGQHKASTSVAQKDCALLKLSRSFFDVWLCNKCRLLQIVSVSWGSPQTLAWTIFIEPERGLRKRTTKKLSDTCVLWVIWSDIVEKLASKQQWKWSVWARNIWTNVHQVVWKKCLSLRSTGAQQLQQTFALRVNRFECCCFGLSGSLILTSCCLSLFPR